MSEPTPSPCEASEEEYRIQRLELLAEEKVLSRVCGCITIIFNPAKASGSSQSLLNDTSESVQTEGCVGRFVVAVFPRTLRHARKQH